jgi:hypothetical protein
MAAVRGGTLTPGTAVRQQLAARALFSALPAAACMQVGPFR